MSTSAIFLEVPGAPPAKDGAKSIRAASHRDTSRVAALRAAMRSAMTGRQPFARQPLRLTVHFRRGPCRADGLNLINGIADIIQRRAHHPSHIYDVWLLDDDIWIRAFCYSEEPVSAAEEGYTVLLEPIPGAPASDPRRSAPVP